MFHLGRILLLAGITALSILVGVVWYQQRATLSREAPRKPSLLPENTHAAARSWSWSKAEGGRTKVEVFAHNFRQVEDHLDLEDVELHLYAPDGRTYDLVRSAKARFDQEHGTLYSDGEVEITKGVPAEGEQAGRLVTIHSSGVSFDSNTGKASTDRPASFTFDSGDGKCTGVSYDPGARELVMKSAVELNWRGRGPKSEPMKIEAAELAYRERESLIQLRRSSKLVRGGTTVEAGDATVLLNDGVVESVEAANAKGADRTPDRTLDYAANQIWIAFTPDTEIRKISGEGDARITATSETARTTLACRRVDMDFDAIKGQSSLTHAMAQGQAALESVPAPRKNAPTPETRTLHSDAIEISMRSGGREIERLTTHAPGRLDFIPNAPGQRRRALQAERMRMDYGPDNTPREFTAQKASTETAPEKKGAAPLRTWSDDLKAEFDTRGELARMEQWNHFRYEEGDRRGRAERAVLEQASGMVILNGKARFQDSSGSVAADRIELAQKTGDVTAQGHVVSTRQPDQKGSTSAMLSQDEPMEARAERMTSAEKNHKVHYEGGATLWQGANRLQADGIDIDRTARVLLARGHVRTQFVDQQNSTEGGARKPPAAAPAFVVVESGALEYHDAERVADYTGGARLTRPGMTVKAAHIRAFLNDSKAESSLDRAYADGAVEIVRAQPGRTIRFTSEHAEYYAAEQRLVLVGGTPALEDSLHGRAQGRELIYYAKNDRLLVNGAERAPAVSTIHKRPPSP